MNAVLCKLHGAIQQSRQTSVHVASVAIVAQCCLAVDTSASLDHNVGTSGPRSWMPPLLAPL